jgi:carbon storage regulator
MIVMSRRINESIVIQLGQKATGEDELVEVYVVDVRTVDGGHRVRLGVQAPREVPVHRKEIYDALRIERD